MALHERRDLLNKIGVSLSNEADTRKPVIIRELKHSGILEKVLEVMIASKNQDVYVESMF